MDLSQTIKSACHWMESRQYPGGYWMGMLQSNACIEAEWILAFHVLGQEEALDINKLAKGILDEQRPDGSWETYYNAPQGDINSTVESYVALRVAGLDPASEALTRARSWIHGQGGLASVRVFTRYWLALIGEWPWETIPAVPPEIIFFPTWSPFSIYKFAAWARATIVPLSILSARQPVRPLPADRRPREIFPEQTTPALFTLPKRGNLFSWERFFHLGDAFLRKYQKLGLTPGREMAIKLCLEWILKHQDADGSWGGIQPPWIYSLMALHNEGYHASHPVLDKGTKALQSFWSFESDDALHVQACNSPVWDTVLMLMAVTENGSDYSHSPKVSAAVDWLLDQQILEPGDWQVTVKGVEPGGWAYEHANLRYPDIDDTAVALLVLSRFQNKQYHDPKRLQQAIERGRKWVLAMQSKNGGWAAFDKDNTSTFLAKIPFCDFGEVLDPPSVDVTAHVLEALGHLGMDISNAQVGKAVAYLLQEQESDGCWFGRWGVNYIYGTGAVLPALRAVGFDMHSEPIRRAADWLVDRQNQDGGWGERCESYMDDQCRGQGESTPSQTAWAVLGLLAAGDAYQRAVERGINFLVANIGNGTWHEPHYTGTGFPGYGQGTKISDSAAVDSSKPEQGTELSRGFMIKYHLYSHYFPLMALGRANAFLQQIAAKQASGATIHCRQEEATR